MFARAIERHLDHVPSAAERARERRCERRGRSARAPRPSRGRAPARARSSPCGTREEALEHGARRAARHGQVREDPAAVVVAHHDREIRAVQSAGEQPPDGRAGTRGRRTAARGDAERRGRAERRGHQAVDAVRAAVARARAGAASRAGEGVDVAHGHAVRDVERGAVRQRAHSACTSCGVRKRGSAASALGERRARDPVGLPPRSPHARAAADGGPAPVAASAQKAREPARNTRLARCCGSRKPAAGSTSQTSAAAWLAIHAETGVLVGWPPNRTISSGRNAEANAGSRSSRSAPWTSTPSSAVPARSPEAGSAITGQPSAPASAAAASASDASQASGPNTSTPRATEPSARASPPERVLECVRQRRQLARRRGALGQRLHRQRGRQQRLAERQVQVHRSRRGARGLATARRASARA